MNTVFMPGSVRRRLGEIAIMLVGVALAIGLLCLKSNAQPSPRVMAQNDQDECHPWQYRDHNGNCVDRPHVIHHHPGYEPTGGEQCWMECLCQEGTYPSGNSCSQCSYVGTVCMPN